MNSSTESEGSHCKPSLASAAVPPCSARARASSYCLKARVLPTPGSARAHAWQRPSKTPQRPHPALQRYPILVSTKKEGGPHAPHFSERLFRKSRSRGRIEKVDRSRAAHLHFDACRVHVAKVHQKVSCDETSRFLVVRPERRRGVACLLACFVVGRSSNVLREESD